MLIHQHAILFGGDRPNHPRHIGCVDPNCDLYSIVLDSFDSARFLCEQYYLMSPELIIETHNGTNSGAPISIVYVSIWVSIDRLKYLIFLSFFSIKRFQAISTICYLNCLKIHLELWSRNMAILLIYHQSEFYWSKVINFLSKKKLISLIDLILF